MIIALVYSDGILFDPDCIFIENDVHNYPNGVKIVGKKGLDYYILGRNDCLKDAEMRLDKIKEKICENKSNQLVIEFVKAGDKDE